MSDYIPRAQAVFELHVSCDQPTPIGSINGGTGLMVPITGGTVSGERLSGEVMAGGADWAVMHDDGLFVVNARYSIRASDGTIIQVFNEGRNRIDRDRTGMRPVMLTTPRFVAPEGPHAWLNESVFVGTLLPEVSVQSSAVDIVVFKLA